MKKTRLSALTVLTLIIFSGAKAHAGKFDVYFGGFDFSAQTSSTKGSKSGLGAYKIAYQIPLMNHFEVGIGYSLIFSNTFGGDAIFGFDLESSYFPLTPNGALKVQSARTTVTYEALWKPFVGVGYHARQFQSVSTQYTGFSAAIGTERMLTSQFNGKFLLRYGKFAGAKNGEATEITALLGLTFGF